MKPLNCLAKFGKLINNEKDRKIQSKNNKTTWLAVSTTNSNSRIGPTIWFGNLMLSLSPLSRSISTRASGKQIFPPSKDAMIWEFSRHNFEPKHIIFKLKGSNENWKTISRHFSPKALSEQCQVKKGLYFPSLSILFHLFLMFL